MRALTGLLFALWSLASLAQDFRTTGFEPWRTAAVADEGRWKDWHSATLLPAFASPYQRVFRECTEGASAADALPFSFVVVIGAEGRIERLVANRSTRVWTCMRGKLAFERLPAPPQAPFHLLMHQRFREAPVTQD